MSNFIDDFGYWLIAALISFLTVILFLAIRSDGAKESKYMNECMLFHKEYECVAMLRRDSQSVIFINQGGRR